MDLETKCVRGIFLLGKATRLGTFVVKELIREQQRRAKAEEKERLAQEKKAAAERTRQEQRESYDNWCQTENLWQQVLIAQWDEQKGTAKFVNKPPKDVIKQYERLLAVIALRVGLEVFRNCPTINRVYTHVHTPKYERTTGYPYDGCILSCIFKRELFSEIDYSKVEYVHALENFQIRLSRRGVEMLGDVEPYRYTPARDNSADSIDIVTLNLEDLNGDQFEDFAKGLVERMGLRSEKTQKSHDGGIDIWAYSDHAISGGRYIIQCKHWKSTVPVEVVRDLLGAVTREKADAGILLVTGELSPDCYKFVEEAPAKIPIKLIDGTQLRSLLQEYGIAKSEVL